MSDLSNLKEELLKDPEFRKHWMEMQTAADIADAIMDTRIKQDLSREDLARLSGVRAANIRKYEELDKCPDIPTLKRLAEALGCTVRIRFEAKEE